jgi:hypothetical protein
MSVLPIPTSLRDLTEGKLRFDAAGLSSAQWDESLVRFNEYAGQLKATASFYDWCTAYIALNSTQEQAAERLDGNVVIDAMLKASAQDKLSVRRKTKKPNTGMSLGSYRYKSNRNGK